MLAFIPLLISVLNIVWLSLSTSSDFFANTFLSRSIRTRNWWISPVNSKHRTTGSRRCLEPSQPSVHYKFSTCIIIPCRDCRPPYLKCVPWVVWTCQTMTYGVFPVNFTALIAWRSSMPPITNSREFLQDWRLRRPWNNSTCRTIPSRLSRRTSTS